MRLSPELNYLVNGLAETIPLPGNAKTIVPPRDWNRLYKLVFAHQLAPFLVARGAMSRLGPLKGDVWATDFLPEYFHITKVKVSKKNRKNVPETLHLFKTY